MATKLTIAALAVVPVDAGEVVFVRQQRGPYAGWLLLPGGKVEFGESTQDAARRETVEEAGFEVGELTPTGVYEILAENLSYHFVMFACRAGIATRVAAGGHHVDGVLQASVEEVRPHPTVMQILNDAGIARYPARDIEEGLRRNGILMRGAADHSRGRRGLRCSLSGVCRVRVPLHTTAKDAVLGHHAAVSAGAGRGSWSGDS